MDTAFVSLWNPSSLHALTIGSGIVIDDFVELNHSLIVPVSPHKNVIPSLTEGRTGCDETHVLNSVHLFLCWNAMCCLTLSVRMYVAQIVQLQESPMSE